MTTPPQRSSHPAAGWYPDPGQQGMRYWDGVGWTSHLDPRPFGGAVPAPPPGSKRPKWGAWAAAATVVVAGALAVWLVFSLLGLASPIEPSRTTTPIPTESAWDEDPLPYSNCAKDHWTKGRLHWARMSVTFDDAYELAGFTQPPGLQCTTGLGLKHEYLSPYTWGWYTPRGTNRQPDVIGGNLLDSLAELHSTSPGPVSEVRSMTVSSRPAWLFSYSVPGTATCHLLLVRDNDRYAFLQHEPEPDTEFSVDYRALFDSFRVDA